MYQIYRLKALNNLTNFNYLASKNKDKKDMRHMAYMDNTYYLEEDKEFWADFANPYFY